MGEPRRLPGARNEDRVDAPGDQLGRPRHLSSGYVFNGATNTGQVALSTDNGGTWTVAPLTANVAAATAKTVDFTGTVPASDSAQPILLCVQGTGGGGRMNIDLVHVDVEE